MADCAIEGPPTVVLASGSPRRRDLLATVGLKPHIAAIGVDESPRSGESAVELVSRLAADKARAGWTRLNDSLNPSDDMIVGSGWLVVAADTVVVLDGAILGKPEGKAEAQRMLVSLAGRTHHVHTGVAVGFGADVGDTLGLDVAVDTTVVSMRPLPTSLIDWYVATGEPLDKAGGYGIQGVGGLLVDRIEGSYTNVVGLPLTTLDRLCQSHGWPLHRLAADEPAEDVL